MRSIVISMFVCLSVHRITRKPHGRTAPIFMHVACIRGLMVVVWCRYDMVCTSGFVDTSYFHTMAPWRVTCIFLSGDKIRQAQQPIIQPDFT